MNQTHQVISTCATHISWNLRSRDREVEWLPKFLVSYPPYCTITRTLTLYCTIIPRFSLEVLSSILQPRETQKINITNTVYFLANQKRISQEHDWMLLHCKTNKATLTVLAWFSCKQLGHGIKHSRNTKQFRMWLVFCCRVHVHSFYFSVLLILF